MLTNIDPLTSTKSTVYEVTVKKKLTICYVTIKICNLKRRVSFNFLSLHIIRRAPDTYDIKLYTRMKYFGLITHLFFMLGFLVFYL